MAFDSEHHRGLLALPWSCMLPLPPSINEAKTVGTRFTKGGGKGSQHYIVKTAAMKEWADLATARLRQQRPPRLPRDVPYLARFDFYFAGAAADWDNRCKALQDVIAAELGYSQVHAINVAQARGNGKRAPVSPNFNDRDILCALVCKRIEPSDPRAVFTICVAPEHWAEHAWALALAQPRNAWGMPQPLPPLEARAAVAAATARGVAR